MSKAIYLADSGKLVKHGKMYEVVNGIYNKILKAYIVEDGILKLTYSYGAFDSYTGDYTVTEIIDDDGNVYELYALTSSGELKLNGSVDAWLCGGGGGGGTGSKSGSSYTALSYSGGGGAGAFSENGKLEADTYLITIGTGGAGSSAGSTTTIVHTNGTIAMSAAGGDYGTNTANGGSGGTGGGAGNVYSLLSSGTVSTGTGNGVTKYPFDMAKLNAHCAGGGGGTVRSGNSFYIGGAGGTNGGDGSGKGSTVTGSSSNGYTHLGGIGGEKGGGTGGAAGSASSTYTANNGDAATFYGSGGGGGAFAQSSYSSSTTYKGIGGTGYQGVAYLLVPKPDNGFIIRNWNYTGTSELQKISIDGETWCLLTLLDSGVFTFEGNKAKIWLCGGGGGGISAVVDSAEQDAYSGGGGGGGYCSATNVLPGEYTISIGSGGQFDTSGSVTNFIDSNNNILCTAAGGASRSPQNTAIYSTSYGAHGGSGGGGGAFGLAVSTYQGGNGDGKSKFPFELTFLDAHCAGGGGGVSAFSSSSQTKPGGKGGSNGANGDAGGGNVASSVPGAGGVKGGGQGGAYNTAGESATFYGSGGGGGGANAKGYSYYGYNGGSGYQGVCYILYQEEKLQAQVILT